MKPYLVLILIGLAACVAAPPTTTKPPNILLILADDLRRDALGAFGGTGVHTPNLDALAERGAVLTNIVCMGSRHGAVCAPSRAMLLTGRALPHITDKMEGATTLPELLRHYGYQTHMTGKWHNGRGALLSAFPDATAVFEGGMCDHTRVPLFDITMGAVRNTRTGTRHSSEVFADAAIEFLSRKLDRPFFAYVAFSAPHDPRDPPREWLERLADQPLPALPANFRPQHDLDLGKDSMLVRDEHLLGWPRDPQLLREQLSEYRALVAHMDAQIGRILDALAQSGEAANTLVVFASDHGLALGSHGLLGKQSLYEHSMGSPVIVSGPGIPAGRRPGLGYLFDLYPTICAMAGVRSNHPIDGVDLSPMIQQGTSPRSELFTLYAKSQRALRNERWKLIRIPGIDKSLLYDLLNDPEEMQNLADDPQRAQTLTALELRLRQAQHSWGDQLAWTEQELRPTTVDLSGTPRKPDPWQPSWIVGKYFR